MCQIRIGLSQAEIDYSGKNDPAPDGNSLPRAFAFFTERRILLRCRRY